jgi:hypothetical protein
MFISDPGCGFISIPDPGCKGQKKHRIPDPEHCSQFKTFSWLTEIVVYRNQVAYPPELIIDKF